jgi:hypothetical protein
LPEINTILVLSAAKQLKAKLKMKRMLHSFFIDVFSSIRKKEIHQEQCKEEFYGD